MSIEGQTALSGEASGTTRIPASRDDSGVQEALRDADMRIVHVSSRDVTGGAARAAHRVHTGLLRAGCQSSMFVAERRGEEASVREFEKTMAPVSLLRRRFRRARLKRAFSPYVATQPEGYELFSDDRSPYGTDVLRQLLPCDIINLHWVAGFVDYGDFFRYVPQHVPVFWKLDDMNAFTGGCHYDAACGKHRRGCGACPQIGSVDSRDLSNQIWRRKQATFNRLNSNRLHIVANNEWMANEVRESPLLNKFQVTVIPNGIDTDVFAPRESRFARDLFGIPQDVHVVLFVAEWLSVRRKGFDVLSRALEGLADSGTEVLLLSIGRGEDQMQTTTPRMHLGPIDNDLMLSLVYSAADLFVIPSLQDNQPGTVLEATACGTPVVGFDVGGISEMVREGTTGLLVAEGDERALRSGVVDLLASPERRAAMGHASRRIAEQEYPLHVPAARYIDLYRTALEESSRQARSV